MTDFGKRLGHLIKSRRERAGFSIVGLAEEAYEDASKARRIFDLEHGVYANPRPSTYGLIVETLNITPDEIQACRDADNESDLPSYPDPRIYSENTRLVGRLIDVENVVQSIIESDQPIAITGPGGAGKTALADACARYLLEGNFGFAGAWRVSIETGLGWDALAASIGLSIEVPQQALIAGTLARLSKRCVADESFLLIVDNVDTPAMQREFVRTFSATTKIKMLVTSQLIDWSGIAKTYPLPDLLDEDATALIAREAGRDIDDSLEQLALRQLNKLPLALIVVGADLKMTGLSAQAYQDSYEQILGQPPSRHPYEHSLTEALGKPFAHLSEDAKFISQVCAFLDADDVGPQLLSDGLSAVRALAWGDTVSINDFLPSSEARLARAFGELEGKCILRRTDGSGSHRSIHRVTQAVVREFMSASEWARASSIAGIILRAQIGSEPQFESQSWPQWRTLFAHAKALSAQLAGLSVEQVDFWVGAHRRRAQITTSFVHEVIHFVYQSEGRLEEIASISAANIQLKIAAYGHVTQEVSSALLLDAIIAEQLLAEAESEMSNERKQQLEQRVQSNLRKALFISFREQGRRSVDAAYKHTGFCRYYTKRANFQKARLHGNRALAIDLANGAAPELIASDHLVLAGLFLQWSASESKGARKAEWLSQAVHHATISVSMFRQALGELSLSTAKALFLLGEINSKQSELQRDRPMREYASAIILAVADNDPPILSQPSVSKILNWIQTQNEGSIRTKKIEYFVTIAKQVHDLWRKPATEIERIDWPFGEDGSREAFQR